MRCRHLLNYCNSQAYSGPYYEPYLSPLPWGAQWALARYINRGFDLATVKFEKVAKLREQRKTAAAAEEVKKLVEETKKGGPAIMTADDQFATAYARELSTKVCVARAELTCTDC